MFSLFGLQFCFVFFVDIVYVVGDYGEYVCNFSRFISELFIGCVVYNAVFRFFNCFLRMLRRC